MTKLTLEQKLIIFDELLNDLSFACIMQKILDEINEKREEQQLAPLTIPNFNNYIAENGDIYTDDNSLYRYFEKDFEKKSRRIPRNPLIIKLFGEYVGLSLSAQEGLYALYLLKKAGKYKEIQ